MQLKVNDPGWQLQLESSPTAYARLAVDTDGDLAVTVPAGRSMSVSGALTAATGAFSGNVGVGTGASPAQTYLDVQGKAWSTLPADHGVCALIRSAAPSDADNTVQGTIAFGTGGRVAPLAAIGGITTAADRDVMGLVFYTHPHTSDSQPMVEAMRLTGAGQLLVGTTSAVGAGNGGIRVAGASVFDGTTTFNSTVHVGTGISMSYLTNAFSEGARIYATDSSGGTAYPFLSSGNMVFQTRNDTNRDFVFVGGNGGPGVRAVITGDARFLVATTMRGSALAGSVVLARTGGLHLINAAGTGTEQVVGTRKSGWAGATGTASRTTFATGTVTTAQLAERVMALLEDLTSHGLIGA